MSESFKSRVEKKERRPGKILARITFSRHEETEYTGVGKDISEAGEGRSREKGERITREKGVPQYVGHSPRHRAKGTAESIAEGAQIVSGENIPLIRIPRIEQSKIHKPERIKEWTEKLGTEQGAWADVHHYDPDFYDNPEFMETNEDKRARLYNAFDRLITQLTKKEQENPPHLVFVSHYELITLLLDDVFGIKSFGTTNVPKFGEHVDLTVTSIPEKQDVMVEVSFGGQTREVIFDRQLKRPVAMYTL